MNRDKWLNIIQLVESKFRINKEYKQKLGDEIPGEKHVIEFNGPMGKMKMEWTSKARLKDVKTLYSDRIGSGVKINKIYDNEDEVNYMQVFKWDEIGGEWQEIKSDMFQN